MHILGKLQFNNMQNSKKAFGIIELSLVILLIGIFFLSYSKIFPQVVKKSQITKTTNIIESKIDSIISYAQDNHTLPNDTQFQQIGNQEGDIWDQQIQYFYDSTLESNQNICNKNTTDLTVQICTGESPCNPSKTYSNIAFIVQDAGYNQNFETSLVSDTLNIYPTDLEINGNGYDDIVTWMTLDELYEKTYCNREKLKIRNTYIRKIKASRFYDFEIYPEGGVPYEGGNYLWSYTLESSDPFVDSCSDYLVDSKAQILDIDCTIKPKNNHEYQFTFTVSDNDGNSYTRVNYQTTEEVLPTMYIYAQVDVDIYYNKGEGCTQVLNGNYVEYLDGEENIVFYQGDNCTGQSISKAYQQVSSVDKNEDNVVYVIKGSNKPDIIDN